MDYSLLKTLDTSKVKNKTTFVEYVIHIDDESHGFLVEESVLPEFETRFQALEINSYEQFMNTFGNIISPK